MENKRKDAKSSKRRILLVEDYRGLRRALTQLINLESDLEVCAVAGNIGQALSTIANRPFDLAIVDVSLNGASGLELTEVMKSRCPNMPVVIFSSHDELLYVRNAFRAGARGYIVKLVDSTDEILTAVRHVLDGGIYISRRIIQEFSAGNFEGYQLPESENLPSRPEYGTDQKQD
jgi:DNA-binding NarL/FixJ family response regulator